MQIQFGRSTGFTAIYIPRKINSLYQSKLELTLLLFFLSYASTAIEFSVLQGHSKDGFLLSALKKLLFQSQGTVHNLDRGFLVN